MKRNYVFVLLVAATLLLGGCKRKSLSAGAAPDPSGLPVGVYDQTNFNESIWG